MKLKMRVLFIKDYGHHAEITFVTRKPQYGDAKVKLKMFNRDFINKLIPGQDYTLTLNPEVPSVDVQANPNG